jgi:transposase-like protein
MKPSPNPHYRHRFSAEIISHAVWLYHLQYVPRVIVTDKLRSYGAAKREVLPDVEHRQSRYLNNRAENSHRPTRRRERQMQRFKSPHQAQEFLFAHSLIYGHFRPRRHRMAASSHRAARATAFKSGLSALADILAGGWASGCSG